MSGAVQTSRAAVSGVDATEATARQLRDSSLLVLGRAVAVALQFVAQIIIVRSLSKPEYGAFAYALSIVTVLQGLVVFGLPDTVSRYIPIYRAHHDSARLLGTIILAVGMVLALSLLTLGVFFATAGLWMQRLNDLTALALLALIFLVPAESLNTLLNNLFASFEEARAVFWRKAVLAPGLRLLAVVAVVALGGDVVEFGQGYVLASLLGLLIYAWYFWQLLARQGYLRRARVLVPYRDILGFALPLLTTTVIWLLVEASTTILLGYFRDTGEVAAFQAVLPVARLNQLVMLNSAILFTPAAARLYALRDQAGLNQLYWRTAVWVLILSFPIFLMTFAFSETLVSTFYGARYWDSDEILSLLSFGYFFQIATGFNGMVLKTFRKIKYSMAIDVIAAVLNITINLYLIPRYGAFGAALGTASTLVIHNLLKQAGLVWLTGIRMPWREYAGIYLAFIGLALGLVLIDRLARINLVVALVLSLAAAALLLRISREVIRLEQVLPPVLRVPRVLALLRPWLGGQR